MLSHIELIKMGKSVPNVKAPKKTTRKRRKKKKRNWTRKNLTRVKDELVVGSDKNSSLVETFNNLLNKSGGKKQNSCKVKEDVKFLTRVVKPVVQQPASQPASGV